MMRKVVFLRLLAIGFCIGISAQDSDTEMVELVGMVMDNYGSPIKGAIVFVDSIRTRAKTDKNGYYSLEINSNTKLLTVYSKAHGLLSMNYMGQNKVSFLYKDDSKPLKKSALTGLGFKVKDVTGSDLDYETFASILEILDKRFYYAKVTDGRVKIGKGANQFSGDTDPLVLVNGQRRPISILTEIATTDVKLIRVIHNGSEAAEYGGLQASNGVILITLKEN